LGANDLRERKEELVKEIEPPKALDRQGEEDSLGEGKDRGTDVKRIGFRKDRYFGHGTGSNHARKEMRRGGI